MRLAACTVPAAVFCSLIAALTENLWNMIQSLMSMPIFNRTRPVTAYATTMPNSVAKVSAGSPAPAAASTRATAMAPPANARPNARLSFSANSSRESTLNSTPDA